MKNIKNLPESLLLIVIVLLVLFGCKSVEFQTAVIYYYQMNDLDKSIEYLHKAIQKNPADIEAYILLGEIFGQERRYPEMAEALDSASVHISDSIPSHQNFKDNIEYLKDEFWCASFNEGVSNFENEQLADADSNFKYCIIIDETRPEGYINLGLVEERLNNIDSAAMHYEKAFELDPENIDIMFYVADLNNSRNQYEKTIQEMDKILSFHPNLVSAIIEKADAYDYLGELENAKILYQDALDRQPENSDLLFNLGRLYFMQGEYFDAIDRFEIVLKKNPEDLNTITFLGYSYFNLGEDITIYIEEAAENDSIKISTVEINDYKNQATEYFEDAIVYLEQAVNKNTDDPDVLNMLAIAYSNSGQKGKAEEIYNKEKSSRY